MQMYRSITEYSHFVTGNCQGNGGRNSVEFERSTQRPLLWQETEGPQDFSYILYGARDI